MRSYKYLNIGTGQPSSAESASAWYTGGTASSAIAAPEKNSVIVAGCFLEG